MKEKKKKNIINSTELELNGEKLIVGFQNEAGQRSINVLEEMEKELFKSQKVIVKIDGKNKIMRVSDIDIIIITQAFGSIENEMPHEHFTAMLKAYDRYKKWKG